MEKHEQEDEMSWAWKCQGRVVQEMDTGFQVTFGDAQTIPCSCRGHVANPGMEERFSVEMMV